MWRQSFQLEEMIPTGVDGLLGPRAGLLGKVPIGQLLQCYVTSWRGFKRSLLVHLLGFFLGVIPTLRCGISLKGRPWREAVMSVSTMIMQL
jgi:hypothetical protein